jgi:hypothetical protein
MRDGGPRVKALLSDTPNQVTVVELASGRPCWSKSLERSYPKLALEAATPRWLVFQDVDESSRYELWSVQDGRKETEMGPEEFELLMGPPPSSASSKAAVERSCVALRDLAELRREGANRAIASGDRRWERRSVDSVTADDPFGLGQFQLKATNRWRYVARRRAGVRGAIANRLTSKRAELTDLTRSLLIEREELTVTSTLERVT